MAGKCCGQGGGARGVQGGPPRGQGSWSGAGPHDEEVCHGTGERRRDLIDQLKIYLNEFDDKPCMISPPRAAGADALKPLGQHPEYLRKHHQSWMPAHPAPPLITSVGAHEIRPTEDYEHKRHENDEYVTYVDARSKPPPPSCDCAKRNGLQDQCHKPECSPPTPQCLATNPGPCCPPSLGLTGRGRDAVIPHHGAGAQHGAQYGAQHGAQHGAHHGAQHGGQQWADYGADQWPTARRHSAVDHGQEMVCMCKADPRTMPSGKKYLCCPVPLK